MRRRCLGFLLCAVAMYGAVACESLSGLSSADPGAQDGGDACAACRHVDDAAPTDATTATDATKTDAAKADATTPRDAAMLRDAATPVDAEPPVDAACPVQADLLVCSTLPPFLGTQIVDGVGNEFCGYPAVFFDVLDGGAPDARTPVVNAYIQVGWSALGLHFFIHVSEAEVVPAASNMPPWNGDAIEVFASASDILTGPFGPGADEALQVVVGAPSASGSAPSETATSVSGPLPSLPPSDYAARLVAGGYEVEIQLPWSTIAGAAVTSPEAGTSIGLDLACDVHGVDGGAHRQTFLTLHLPSQPPASCKNLYCDDRTWCLWKLAP